MATDRHILFIDDSLEDVEIACWRLRRAGLPTSARVVISQAEMLLALQQRIPDLIVCDIQMPGFDGWSALRVAQAVVPGLPFILHSGWVDDKTRDRAIAGGAYACVNKDCATDFVDLVKNAPPSRYRDIEPGEAQRLN